MLQTQRTFNFEVPRQAENFNIAQGRSRPSAELICPERQLTFGGADPLEWRVPDENSDQTTVDREREDIDGPAHRFIIEVGDWVEVDLGGGSFSLGVVTGINHENQEVCVSDGEENDGNWYDKSRIYPAPPVESDTHCNLR